MSAVDTEIAIVGAGAAGIAAALAAEAHGFTARLIEARPRLGGRTWTATTVRGLPFDVGASWIHAVDQGNPFAELALARRAGPVVDRRRRIVLDAAGAPPDASGLAAFQASRAAAIEQIIAAPAGASLADCLAVGDDPWAWTQRAFAGPWLSGADCAVTDAADWAAARGGDDWLLPEGYGSLVQDLARGLTAVTDCRLQALEITPDTVRLVTTRGDFVAAHVVLTVPLGVLAAERIAFTPALPDAVIDALDVLPMGCLMKVAIDLTADPLGETGSYYLHYPALDETGVLYLIRPCGYAMAYAFVGGTAARALEAESDAAVGDAVLAPLRRLLGARVVERSFGAARASRWASDPDAFGSYAMARPGGAGARATLAEPVLGRLHLAGEATAPDGWHGTAGGAWLAGRRAITRIARTLRQAGAG